MPNPTSRTARRRSSRRSSTAAGVSRTAAKACRSNRRSSTPGRRGRLARSRHGRVGSRSTGTEARSPDSHLEGESRAARRDGPQPVRRQRPRCLHRRPVREGHNNPIACPAASKIGTVEVQTPPLPADSLTGTSTSASRKATTRPPAKSSGSSSTPKSDRTGINVRLVGNVSPNLATGQLTAVHDQTGQLAGSCRTCCRRCLQVGATQIRRRRKGADQPADLRAARRPRRDGPVVGPGQHRSEPSSSFTLTSDPGGGNCPATLGERKFAPAYTANSDTPRQRLQPVPRPHRPRRRRTGAEGRQRHPAEGAAGKLAGIPYCSEARSPPRRRAAAAPSRPARAARRTARSASRRPRPAPAQPDQDRAARRTWPARTRARRSRWRSITPGGRRARTTSAPWWSGWRSTSTRKRPRSTRSPT